MIKLSKFLLTSNFNDNLLVKQLSTGSMIELSQKDFSLLQAGKFETLDQETLQALIECGFLVEGDENEKFLQDFTDWWQKSKFLALFVVPTNNCNYNCPYCYEDGIDRNQYMSPAVCEKVLEWTDEYFKKHSDLKELNLIFHGGEPLLHKKAIRFLLPRMAKLCDRHGVQLTTNIVSNGFHLDRSIAQDLAQYNLQRVQLTLDGPKEINDSRRKLLNGGGTYNQIWDNMKTSISEGFVEKINLRINIDKLNLEDVEPLLLAIKQDPVLSDNVKISLGIITSTTGCDGEISNAQKYVRENGLSDAESAQKYLELIKKAHQLGYEIYDEMMIGPWCASRHHHAWLVGPRGDVYKCTCDIGREEWSVGSIFGEVDSSKILDLADENLQKCLESDCELVPICGGGCLFNMRAEPEQQCRKEFLQIVNRGLMKLQAETQ